MSGTVLAGRVGTESKFIGMLAPRRWRGLVGVLAAQAVAWTGTRVSAIAIPWFVLVATGSVVQTGLIVFVEMFPYVIFQVLSGPIVDRIGARRISIIGDVVSMGVVAVIPLLFSLNILHVWLLLPFVAVIGAFRGPSDAAKAILIPVVTDVAQVPLERGTGLSGTIQRLAATIGPAIAGIAVASVGGPYALAITAALFGLGAAIIGATVPQDRTPQIVESESGYLARFSNGAVFLRKERLLRSIAGMVAVTNLLDTAWTAVLLPVWAREAGYGPEVIGLILGVWSACATAFSLLAAAIAHRVPRQQAYLVGFLVGGAPRFIVLAVAAPLWVIVAVCAISGFGSGFINPILGAVMFERAPPAMYGRIRSLMAAMFSVGIPFGGIVGGSLISLTGLAPALLICGGLYLLTTTLPGLQAEWREMDRDRRRSTP